MFTGIIENIATVFSVKKEGTNLNISFKSAITNELKIDQSLSHNGVCLTVVNVFQDTYTVTAIKETLEKSNLVTLKPGDQVNLERSMKLGGRLDGHIVQGHVDQTAECTNIIEDNGSWIFTFYYKSSENITVEKGSVCVNGVSLTVIKSQENSFSVAVIPYTYHNTNFHTFEIGTIVNIEFDILGKYINKIAFMNR
tara:strand:- start:9 stop:596 length:588 start_codon:yes stop_codon:yes gene_type:complete